VALLLKQYKFGAVSAAKYLGKPRGLIQSWMQIGNKHYLAKEKIRIKSFEKILKRLRRKITKENLNYFLAKRLLDLKLPVAFISKVLELPTSTVRSWRYGKVPVEIKKFFYDRHIVDNEYNKLLRKIRNEFTTRNLEYFLAIYISDITKDSPGRRLIGGRVISKILTNHFGYIEPIPEKTISCWIEGKRKPWDAFRVLMNERMVQKEFKRIVEELTVQHINYHISMELAQKHNWKYSKISKVLGINKEVVRGWVKKGRGNPVAKTFVNESVVKQQVSEFVDNDNSANYPILKNSEISTRDTDNENLSTTNSLDLLDPPKPSDEEKENFYSELEKELIYHLETIPTGISSPRVLKSILIHHRNASLMDIKKVLQESKHIVQNQTNGKWMLKQFVSSQKNEPNLDEDFKRMNCRKDQDDEIIC
jgi:hypothetical protein